MALSLDDIKNETAVETTEPVSADGDLVDSIPNGGFGGTLDPESIQTKVLKLKGTDEEAIPAANDMIAKAYSDLNIGLYGLQAEMLQIQQKGEELRDAGIEITPDMAEITDFNPNSAEEIQKRQSEYVPGSGAGIPVVAENTTPVTATKTENPAPVAAPKTTEPEDSDDEVEDEYVPGEGVTPVPDMKVSTNIVIDDSDFEDLDEDDDEDVETEDEEMSEEEFNTRKNKLMTEIKGLLNVIPEDDVIDFSKAVVSSKKMSAKKAITYSVIPATTSSGVLYMSGRKITMSALSTSEIAQFNPEVLRELENMSRGYVNANSRRTFYMQSVFNYYRSLAECMYEHITSPKPSFKEWRKTIAWGDIADLIMCAHIATYGNVGNILTYECEDDGCKEVFAQIKDVNEMIKVSDAAKARYDAIANSTGETAVFPLESEMVQVCSKYAFKLGSPTLDTIMEIASLDMDFATKYIDLISITQYIKEAYFIDKTPNGVVLVPIETKEYDDSKKTAKAKLKELGDIITKSLTSDQRQSLIAKTDKFDRDESAITYIYPGTVCPKCGKPIKEMIADPATVLFTRYQLVTMVNS